MMPSAALTDRYCNGRHLAMDAEGPEALLRMLGALRDEGIEDLKVHADRALVAAGDWAGLEDALRHCVAICHARGVFATVVVDATDLAPAQAARAARCAIETDADRVSIGLCRPEVS